MNDLTLDSQEVLLDGPLTSFEQLNLSKEVSKSIKEMGFEKPSEIQAKALPILLGDATDFLGLAATGTGKTAAFGIPLIEKIEARTREVQALIMCPTRELALQVAGQINLLGKHKGIGTVPVYGGASYGDQIRGIKQGAAVVIGTPGRIVDHLERGTLNLSQVKTLILDEADEMISMGFKEEMETILRAVSQEDCNKWMFSATMSRDVRKVADEFLKDPEFVQINKTEMLPSTIKQIFYMTHEADKPSLLCDLIDAADGFYGLVFCQTKALVTDLTNYLVDRGYKVDNLHGDKDQTSRERTMRSFRERKVSLLICTDVASRGLDVKDITHVINYSIPRELDSYVHRVGRTARSGKEGFAMSLVTNSHKGLIGQIERMTKSKMIQGMRPTANEIALKKLAQVFPKFEKVKLTEKALETLDETWKTLLAGLSAEQVATKFLAMIHPEIFKSFMIRDRAVKSESDKSRRDSFDSSSVKITSETETLSSVAPEKERGSQNRSYERRSSSENTGYGRSRESSYGRSRESSYGRESSRDRESSYGRESAPRRDSSYGRESSGRPVRSRGPFESSPRSDRPYASDRSAERPARRFNSEEMPTRPSRNFSDEAPQRSFRSEGRDRYSSPRPERSFREARPQREEGGSFRARIGTEEKFAKDSQPSFREAMRSATSRNSETRTRDFTTGGDSDQSVRIEKRKTMKRYPAGTKKSPKPFQKSE
jgi:ATP-dependent RNA helicase DeaD